MLDDEMGLDDETVDLAVGCTLDLFVRQADQCKLIFKSTCYKSFTLVVDLSETLDQLKERIAAQETELRASDMILMNLSGSGQAGELQSDVALAD